MHLEEKYEMIDYFRRELLAACLTPKTCNELCKIMNVTASKAHFHLNVLCKLNNLKKIEFKVGTSPRVMFETITLDYKRKEVVMKKKNHVATAGHFVHRIEDYADKHIKTSQQTRKDAKSRRTHVGISNVYNG